MAGLPWSYALLNLARRPVRTILLGLAQAVATAALVAAASFAHDLDESFQSAGQDDAAILLSRVAEGDVLRSTVPAAAAGIVGAEVRGVRRIGDQQVVSSEIHMGTDILLGPGPGAPGESRYPAYVRGVTPAAFLVHAAVTIEEGRPPGTGEVLVGALAAAKADAPAGAFAVGRTLRIEGGEFRIAGRFRAPGTTFEAEVWAPLEELRGLTRRDDSSAVFVRMESPEGLGDLAAFAFRRLDLELNAIPTRTYYGALAAYFAPIRQLALLMALLVGGAVLAMGASTQSTVVRERQAELGTLRAIGFSAWSLARSLLLEALLLAAAGALVGIAAARFAIDGAAFRIGMTAFALGVGPAAILLGTAGSLALALLGTVPAAWRVLRLPVAASQRET
jgi:putative ABC transport system permease protein